jgi:tetratricopeptide (TPR) repeat protein
MIWKWKNKAKQDSSVEESESPDAPIEEEETDVAATVVDEPPEDGDERFPPSVQRKAISCFRRAVQIAGTHNYDYALELYRNGVAMWPAAIDEGIKPMYELGIQRAAAGGKKVGMGESMKYSTGTRDSFAAVANALLLLSKDPENIGHMESVLKAANRGQLGELVEWLGPLWFRYAQELKSQKLGRYQSLGKIFEKSGALTLAVQCAQVASEIAPGNMQLRKKLKDLAASLSARDYNDRAESEHDEEFAADETIALDEQFEPMVEEETPQDIAVNKARQQYESDPTDIRAAMKLVNASIDRRNDGDEQFAIDLLEAHYERTRNFRLKIGADDIRIRQLRRRARRYQQALDQAPPDRRKEVNDRFEEAASNYRAFAIDALRQRCERYPTDRQIRFQYGEALFEAKEFDEALDEFMKAKDDRRVRSDCLKRIGQCYLEKGAFREAAASFKKAIDRHKVEGDAVAKELYYRFGRCLEELGRKEDAVKAYSRVALWQSNYHDVSERLSRLSEA